MKTWNVVALTPNDDWRVNVCDCYPTKREAVKAAKRLLNERGHLFESITIWADNGCEILDDTMLSLK